MKQIICLSNEPWSASPGRTQQLLSRLKDAGVRVFTASNGIGEVMNGRVEMAGLSGYLTGRFAADDVGAMKPSRQYFDTVFRRSG